MGGLQYLFTTSEMLWEADCCLSKYVPSSSSSSVFLAHFSAMDLLLKVLVIVGLLGLRILTL